MGYSGAPVTVCGRKLHGAADDLGLPALFFLFFRSILILITVVIFAVSYVDDTNNCEPLNPLRLYYSLTLASTILIQLAYIKVYAVASKGDLFQKELRQGIDKWLYVLLATYVVEVGVQGYGIYVATLWGELVSVVAPNPAAFVPGCGEIDVTVKFALVVFWLIWIFLDLAWFLWFVILLVSRPKKAKQHELRLDEFERRQGEWEQRCRLWCCWGKVMSCGMLGTLNGEYSDHAYDQVAQIFGAWFYGHDMSVVEFITAVLLLRVEQRKRNEAKMMKMWNGKEFKTGEVDYSFRTMNPVQQTEGKDLSVIGTSIGETTIEDDDIVPESVGSSHLSRDLQTFLWGAEAEDEETGQGEHLNAPVTLGKGKIPKFQKKRSAIPLDVSIDSQDKKDLQFITDYLPYMLAIYGWKLLVYMDTIEFRPFRSMSKLLKLPTRNRNHAYQDDNTCKCARSALLTQGGIADENVLYASFSVVEAMSIPHAILVDHEKLSIVVSCRGSLSLSDLLTDAMIEPVSLLRAGERWGFDGKGHYAHSGMLLIAENIRIQLQKSGILHKLFGIEQTYEVPTNLDAKERNVNVEESIRAKLDDLPDCSGYDLIVIGHSLGAGVAAILSIMLKPEFPDLRCISYSAPGCVLDMDMCRKVKDWMLSPFVGHDIVPHLSWRSLKKLRGQLLEVLRRSKANKNEIIRKATLTGRSGAKLAGQLLYEEDEVPLSEDRTELLELIRELAKDDPASQLDRVSMGCPGKIMHFPKTSSERTGCCKSDRNYDATWVDQDDMDDVNVSTRMLFDHFPNFGAFIIHQTNSTVQFEARRPFMNTLSAPKKKVPL